MGAKINTNPITDVSPDGTFVRLSIRPDKVLYLTRQESEELIDRLSDALDEIYEKSGAS